MRLIRRCRQGFVEELNEQHKGLRTKLESYAHDIERLAQLGDLRKATEYIPSPFPRTPPHTQTTTRLTPHTPCPLSPGP